MTKRVVIYTRVSKDRLGDERSPSRQEADCRAFAAIRDWTVGAVYCDVDLSAYNPRVKRPGYEALLEAIGSRHVEGVVVWKLDRLVRRSAEFERFWASCERAEVLLASVTEPIDTSTELGLAIVRILVTFAGLESSTKSLRLKAAERAAALAGERHPGARAFGYAVDRSVIVPEEAALIREGAARVLGGESLAAIARDFSARGIPRVGGGTMWTGSALRRILNHPSLAGLRDHQGEIVAKGTWPAILDEVTSARLRLLFADPARRYVSPRPTPHLLRGFLRCGRCGRRLRAGHSGPPDPQAYYSCRSLPHGCRGISIRRDLIDDLVASMAMERMAEVQHPSAPRPRAQPNGAATAQLLEQQRVHLQRVARDYYVERVIDRLQFLALRDDLIARLDSQRGEIIEPGAEDALARLGRKSPARAWKGFDTAQRRELLGAVLDHVVVHPAPRDNHFHPERVEMFWRGHGSLPATVTRAVPPPKRRRSDPAAQLSLDQAAAYLEMKEQSVLRLVRRGALEATRRAGGWQITQGAIDAYLRSRRGPATALITTL
jgi:DNA invertase Pin-like site-specific DNA recombinase